MNRIKKHTAKAVFIAIILSVLMAVSYVYPALNTFTYPNFQYLDTSTGSFGVGYKLYSYSPGTSTPKPTYSDAAHTTANTNPVILDSRGEARVYLSGNSKFRANTSDDVFTGLEFTTAGSPSLHRSSYYIASPGTNLSTLFTSIGSTDKATVIIESGTHTLSSNATATSNIKLILHNGAVIRLGNYTFTVNGHLEAGLYQVFSCTGTGTVIINGTPTIQTAWFGLDTTGNDDISSLLTKLQAAMDGQKIGRTLEFMPGTYKIAFPYDTTTTYCTFSGYSGLTIKPNGCTFDMDVSGASEWNARIYGYPFLFSACDGVSVLGETKASGDDMSEYTVNRGVILYGFIHGCQNVFIDAIYATGGLMTPVDFFFNNYTTDTASYQCKNVVINNIYAANCLYGASQHGVQGFTLHNLKTNKIGRSFYCLGGRRIRANVFSKDPQLSEDCGIGIWKYDCTGDADDVRINYVRGTDSTSVGGAASGNTSALSIAWSDQGCGTPRKISNVKFNICVDFAGNGDTGGAILKLIKYDSGGSPDTADQGWQLENLEVSGRVTGDPSYTANFLINFGYSCVWNGTADVFKNIIFRDFTSTSTIKAMFALKALQGNLFLLDGVKTAANWRITDNQATHQPWDVGGVEVRNSYIPNLDTDYAN